MQVTGQVKGIFPMKGRAAGKGQNLLVDGTYYADWEMVNVSIDEQVSFEAEVKGEYNGKPNYAVVANTLKKQGGTSQPTAKKTYSAPRKSSNSVGDFEKQRLIVAQNSMTNAFNFTVALLKTDRFKLSEKDVSNYAIELAGVLARKIMSGELYETKDFVEEPKEAKEATFQDDDMPFK